MPEAMFELANRAFQEDRAIIEAQARNQKLRPEPHPLMIGHDRGPSLLRAVMQKMIEREQAAGLPRAVSV
jgi:hypothetical protein